jgi:hypothetical protein
MLGQMSLFQPDASLPLRQRVQVEIITTAQARYMLEAFHYLHRARVGRQINYAVLIDGVVDGVITYAYPMMSVPLLGVPSDELIEFARLFLQHNVPHSATCAIGKTLRRVQDDWTRMFPDAPVPRLVVSWSDTVYHKGTIYKAANFEWVKRTKGDNRKALRNSPTSKRGQRKHPSDYAHDKDCWVYWLKTKTKNKGDK